MILGRLNHVFSVSVIFLLVLTIDQSNCQFSYITSGLSASKDMVSYAGTRFMDNASKVMSGVSYYTTEFINSAKEKLLSQDWNIQGFKKAFQDAGASFLETAVTYNKSRKLNAGKDVKFYLYTKNSNLDEGVEITAGDDFGIKGFIPGAPVKIICHGFLSDYKAGPGQFLLPAYIGPHKPPVNVILIDWSKYAGVFTGGDGGSSLPGLQSLYFPPARYTETVGNFTANLVTSLILRFSQGRVGSPLTSIHLIGHSLGAHSMGWAGNYFQRINFGWKLPRITGLDPAAPCFETNLNNVCFDGNYRHISAEDAYFVDIIHTHGRFYGYVASLGHVDFFPNGGIAQPGCSSVGFGICSHTRSVELMASTVIANQFDFVAQKCVGWENFVNGTCFNTESAQMGEHVPNTARGNFYLKTSGTAPLTAVY